MELNYDEKAKLLSLISDEISADSLPKSDSEWDEKSIDIVIVPLNAPTKSDPQGGRIVYADETSISYHPLPRYIFTDYSLELSWMFNKMKIFFDDLLDKITKNELFERFANVIEVYQRNHRIENPRELLRCIIHEAYAILDEIREGYYFALPISELYNLNTEIETAERNGYLGTDATLQFLNEMERGKDNV